MWAVDLLVFRGRIRSSMQWFALQCYVMYYDMKWRCLKSFPDHFWTISVHSWAPFSSSNVMSACCPWRSTKGLSLTANTPLISWLLFVLSSWFRPVKLILVCGLFAMTWLDEEMSLSLWYLECFQIIYLWTWRLQQWFRLENSRWIPSVQFPPLPWIFGTIPPTSFACPWVATGESWALPANPVAACRVAGFRSAVQKNIFSSCLSWKQSPELLPENYLHQGSAEFFFALVLAFHQIKDLLLGEGLGVALFHLLQQQSVFLVIGFLRFSLDVKKERAQKVTCIRHDKLPQIMRR